MPYRYKPQSKNLSPELDPNSKASGTKGPTKLTPEPGSKKAQPESPGRADEPAPGNSTTTVVQMQPPPASGQPRVLVLLGVLLALEAVVHPGIKTWLQGVIAGLNTGLSKGAKK
jgi:hypothetical protein